MGVCDIIEDSDKIHDELMGELPVVFAADISDEESDEEDALSQADTIPYLEDEEAEMEELVQYYSDRQRHEDNDNLYCTINRSDLSNLVRFMFPSSMTTLRIKRYFNSQCDYLHLKAQHDLWGYDLINCDTDKVRMVQPVFYSAAWKGVIHEKCYECLLAGEDKDEYVSGHYVLDLNKRCLVEQMLGVKSELYFCDSCGYGLIDSYYNWDGIVLGFIINHAQHTTKIRSMSDDGYVLHVSNLNDVSVTVDE